MDNRFKVEYKGNISLAIICTALVTAFSKTEFNLTVAIIETIFCYGIFCGRDYICLSIERFLIRRKS